MRLNERMLDHANFQRRKATVDTVRKLSGWEIWECSAPTYSHDYVHTVSLYVHAGKAVLEFCDGSQVDLQAGDFLTIEAGSRATWTISTPMKNSFKYHDTFESAAQRQTQLNQDPD